MTMPRTAALLLAACLPAAPPAPGAETPPSVAEATAGAERRPGFFDFWLRPSSGRVLLAIDRFDEEFLYAGSLATGLGSNDIGLDRGQPDGGRLVRFERHGGKVLLKQRNLRYRALSDSAPERLAVEEAFAESVLWGFPVAAESGGRVLVDLTEFLLRDAHGVADALRAAGQGGYAVDPARSAVYAPRTRNFPDNSEFEAQLTFGAEGPGGELVRSVSPDARSVTLRLHHSFVRLPGPGYVPRRFHPRSGFWARSHADYASPIGQDLTRRLIARHRLQKRDPGAARSEAVEPIVYHLDPGVPEPVRSALLDGARWWAEAFEAIGFVDAFRVEMLPEGADPMDIRYNVIQWVHRSTRGWSYGSSVVDPRTGEIIKGKVTLGSLRVRQDHLIAQALLGLAGEGADEALERLALARIRQLSAHEVGHTLGLAHNFAASVDGRASVMDYPHPLLALDEGGAPAAPEAYGEGLGRWDLHAIRYGYGEYESEEDERAGLAAVLRAGRDLGLHFVSDQDGRPPGAAHPLGNMWDNGDDPARELRRLLSVRAAAMARFGADNLRPGRPYAELEELLVPLYLLHRYQVEAAQKTLGGIWYDYAVRGEAPPDGAVVRPVSAERQWRAFDALLETVSPETLRIPARVLALIPPKPIGYARGRESFPLRTALGVDPVAVAETAADHTLRGILQRERLARISGLSAAHPGLPTVHEILDRLLERVFYRMPADPALAAIQRAVNHALLFRLMELARGGDVDNQVRAQVRLALLALRGELDRRLAGELDAPWRANYRLARDEIVRWLDDGAADSLLSAPLPMPPGAPI